MPSTFSQAVQSAAFLKRNGQTVPGSSALKGKKLVAVYCSAHWCPPCRGFTPHLAQFYARYKAQDPSFEIIFCSSDRSDEEMRSYFASAHGDWLCCPFGSPVLNSLRDAVNARGIPALAVFTADGTLVQADGRGRVMAGVEAVVREGWGTERTMFQAFQGSGRSTGGTAAPPAPQRGAAAAAPTKWEVDEGKEVTTLQLVFPDGAKVPVKFNTHHTVGDVRTVVATRPGTNNVPFVLLSGFPKAELKNNTLTINEAGLKRAQITVALR